MYVTRTAVHIYHMMHTRVYQYPVHVPGTSRTWHEYDASPGTSCLVCTDLPMSSMSTPRVSRNDVNDLYLLQITAVLTAVCCGGAGGGASVELCMAYIYCCL